MTSELAVAGLLLLAGWLGVAPPTRAAAAVPPAEAEASAPTAGARRWLCLPVGAGVAVVVGGPVGLAAGGTAAVLAWRALGGPSSATVRRRRRVVRDLPHLVALLAATVRAGADPVSGLRVSCAALPGPAADRLAEALSRLDLGQAPVEVWHGLALDPDLAPLGRALARSEESGAAVATVVERLGAELAQRTAAQAEDRARTVGVRAAVPLGVCLLPAFMLLGIVPSVAGLLAGLSL